MFLDCLLLEVLCFFANLGKQFWLFFLNFCLAEVARFIRDFGLLRLLRKTCPAGRQCSLCFDQKSNHSQKIINDIHANMKNKINSPNMATAPKTHSLGSGCLPSNSDKHSKTVSPYLACFRVIVVISGLGPFCSYDALVYSRSWNLLGLVTFFMIELNSKHSQLFLLSLWGAGDAFPVLSFLQRDSMGPQLTIFISFQFLLAHAYLTLTSLLAISLLQTLAKIRCLLSQDFLIPFSMVLEPVIVSSDFFKDFRQLNILSCFACPACRQGLLNSFDENLGDQGYEYSSFF